MPGRQDLPEWVAPSERGSRTAGAPISLGLRRAFSFLGWSGKPGLTPSEVPQKPRTERNFCRGAIKTGQSRAIKTGIMLSEIEFCLATPVVGTETGLASAEDRALRGRNLSADRSLANGRSGRFQAARLAPAGASLKAINPSIQPFSTTFLAGKSGFVRTRNSGFESYTTDRKKFLAFLLQV